MNNNNNNNKHLLIHLLSGGVAGCVEAGFNMLIN